MEIGGTQIRRPYLDWLRIIIVALLIPFHAALTYTPYPFWFVHSGQNDLALEGLVTVLDKFQMPLLFLIAGAAVFFSLGIRSWKQFALERLLRLVIPLAFGMLVLVPPCYWVAARSLMDYQGTLWQFYPQYWGTNMLPSSLPGLFKPGVLWFLWYLVIYTIILSPLFILIRRRSDDKVLSRLGRLFANPWAIFSLFIPIVLVLIYADNTVLGLSLTGNFRIFYYVIFFIYGFFIYSLPNFQKGIDKSGPAAVITGLITLVLTMLLSFPYPSAALLGPKFWAGLNVSTDIAHTIVQVIAGLCTWSCIVALIYLTRRFLNFTNGFVRYGNEAVLPYYIFHGTALALVAYWLIDAPLAVWPQYLVTVLLSFAATIAFFEVMKRTLVTRLLIGMRLRKGNAGKIFHPLKSHVEIAVEKDNKLEER